MTKSFRHGQILKLIRSRDISTQDELARANDNQIKALYRYNQSRADLARATGQMEQTYSK